MHEGTKIGTRNFQHQVDMIRHKTEEIQTHIIPLQTSLQSKEESLTIPIPLKNSLPGITTHRHMVNCTFISDL